MSENGNKEGRTALSEKIRLWCRRAVLVGKETYHVFSRNDMNIFSGNATLYILMSLIPFITLVAGSINFLPEEYLYNFCDMFVGLFPNIPQIQDFMYDLIAQINPRTGTVVISVSLLTMLWSASYGVSAIQAGLMRISSSRQSIVRRRLAAMVFTVLFIVMIFGLLIFRVLRSSISDIGLRLSLVFQSPEISEILHEILKDGGLITTVSMGFMVLLTYTFLQGYLHRIRRQLPGAVFTTILWIAFSELFEWFIVEFWTASALYGSLASLFLTALWLRTIITILFLGASLNAALYQIMHSDQWEAGRTSSEGKVQGS